MGPDGPSPLANQDLAGDLQGTRSGHAGLAKQPPQQWSKLVHQPHALRHAHRPPQPEAIAWNWPTTLLISELKEELH